MTPYALMLQACGLSHREAAELHGVRIDTVKSWSAGRNSAPPGVIAELRTLYAQVAAAARNNLDALSAAPADAEFELGYPVDDHEARELGFPCVGAWRAMCAIVVAELWRPVDLVPRGTTVATAAAKVKRKIDREERKAKKDAGE